MRLLRSKEFLETEKIKGDVPNSSPSG